MGERGRRKAGARRAPPRSGEVVLAVAAALLFYTVFVITMLQPFGGNATSMIRFGDRFAGSRFAGEDVLIQSDAGYDGQFFFYIASDPRLLDPDRTSFLDHPSYRYGRILYPLLAWLAAAGQTPALPWTLIVVNVIAAVTGTAAAARLLLSMRVPAWTSIFFALSPPMVIGVAGDLSDPVMLALLAIGWMLHWQRRRTAAALALAMAALARETAAVSSIGFVIDAARRRAWREAATYCGALALPGAWHLSVWHRLGLWPALDSPSAFSWPLSGPLYRAGVLLGLRVPALGETLPAVVWPEVIIVTLSLAAMTAGLVILFRRRDVLAIQFSLQALLTLCTSPYIWIGFPGYARALGPLYLTGALAALGAGAAREPADTGKRDRR